MEFINYPSKTEVKTKNGRPRIQWIDDLDLQQRRVRACR